VNGKRRPGDFWPFVAIPAPPEKLILLLLAPIGAGPFERTGDSHLKANLKAPDLLLHPGRQIFDCAAGHLSPLRRNDHVSGFECPTFSIITGNLVVMTIHPPPDIGLIFLDSGKDKTHNTLQENKNNPDYCDDIRFHFARPLEIIARY
jgi:hypothetical protein